MSPPKQKQPKVKKGLCRVLEHVDVDLDVDVEEKRSKISVNARSTTKMHCIIFLPVTRDEVFIWQNVQPAYRDTGWKKQRYR